MAESFYISDHHICHHNIIRYGERPFKDLAEMHDALLTYHNETVKPNDHVSFLGDVTLKRGGRLDREWFCKEMRRYHGHKRLYLGNHDHWPVQVYLDAGFEKIYATWLTEERVLCSHIPIHPQSLGPAICNVHGHIHQHSAYPAVVKLHKDKKGNDTKVIVPYINVSCEAINYKPIHRDEILAMVAKLNER